MIRCYLNVRVRVRNIISKGPQYRFPCNIDSRNYRREITASLNDFINRWYKRENVESDVLREWKVNMIFKILILVFHFTLVLHIFYPLNLTLLFVILNALSRVFI